MCFSTESPIPDDTDPNNRKTPQLVVLSFDDAITKINFPFYEIISELKNPNDCNISMTFFVSHTYTDYSLVHEQLRRGNEIAVHSVT